MRRSPSDRFSFFWIFYGLSNNLVLSSQFTCFCCLLLQLTAMYFLLKSIKVSLSSTLFAICMYLAWIPRFLAILFYIHMVAYSNQVILTFLILSIFVKLENEVQEPGDLKKGKVMLLLLLGALLACTGFTTIRMAATIYLPFFVIKAIKLAVNYLNTNRVSLKGAVLTGVSFIYLVINIALYVLLLKVHGDVFEPLGVNLRPITADLNIKTTLNYLFSALGIAWGGALTSTEGIRFILNTGYLFLSFFAIGWILVKKVQDYDLVAFWSTTTAATFLISLLMGVSSDRYYFATIILLPVLCGVALDDWEARPDGGIDLLPNCILSVGIIFIFGLTIKIDTKTYRAPLPALTKVAEYIEENGYKYVTASGGNAAVIKGYTNGAVEYQHDIGGGRLVKHEWIIDKRKYDSEFLGVPNILLLTDEEEVAFLSNRESNLLVNNFSTKICEIENYNLYAFTENPFTLIKKVEEQYGGGLPKENIDYKITYPDALGFSNRNSFYNDARELVSDGTSATILWGPYMQSTQGTYDITLHYVVDSYTASDTGVFDVALNGIQMAVGQFTAQDDSLTLHDVTLDGGALFEARVWVPDGMIARIQSIEYQRIH